MDIKQELVEKIFDKEAKGRIKVEALWLATSIKQWTVTASLIVHKLGAYPHQNSLALALCELGRVERTLFTLEWLQNSEPRRRVQVGLNKGEAKNALESLPGGR
jgi:TnpA family transposase